MAMIHLPPDFKELLNSFNAQQVEYLLIGGYAVGYYGYPRATADMDIWVAVYPENAEKIVTVLKEFGFDVPELSTELFLKEDQIVRMGLPPIRIEIVTSISGVHFPECFAERVVANLDGVDVNIISIKHLIINKRASGRYKDLNDLDNLP
jgi:predicted nucleotidyltransferase